MTRRQQHNDTARTVSATLLFVVVAAAVVRLLHQAIDIARRIAVAGRFPQRVWRPPRRVVCVRREGQPPQASRIPPRQHDGGAVVFLPPDTYRSADRPIARKVHECVSRDAGDPALHQIPRTFGRQVGGPSVEKQGKARLAQSVRAAP